MREVKDGEEDEDSILIVKAYAVGTSTESKLKPVSLETKEEPKDICVELAREKSKQYLEVVDFDEHFNDVSLDWTNLQFNE